MAKPTPQQPIEPEVLDAREETQLAKTSGGAIQEFLEGVARFFNGAAALERRAHATLANAKAIVAPTTAEADLEVQGVIVDAGNLKKDAEAYWDGTPTEPGITRTMYAFHKRLVAGRARSTDVLDEALAIANGHHQRYVQAEKRRAAEEQERRRQEQEAQAKRDRDAEAARLEQQALDAEAAAPTLSPREARFVSLMAEGMVNDGRAAQLAGYKDGPAAAVRLMAASKIQEAIEAAKTAAAARAQAAAVKKAPVVVEHVGPVKAKVQHIAGKGDRDYWSAEILDGPAFVAAVLSGKYGIPADTLMPDPVKLNTYAKSLHERIDLWPGVRHRKETKLV